MFAGLKCRIFSLEEEGSVGKAMDLSITTNRDKAFELFLPSTAAAGQIWFYKKWVDTGYSVYLCL